MTKRERELATAYETIARFMEPSPVRRRGGSLDSAGGWWRWKVIECIWKPNPSPWIAFNLERLRDVEILLPCRAWPTYDQELGAAILRSGERCTYHWHASADVKVLALARTIRNL